MEAWLTQRWYGDSVPVVLRPLAALYGGLMRARTAAYRLGLRKSFDVGRPVLVVGNLTVGGTGKTPLVAWLARQLKAEGLRVGILSRGHGRIGLTPREVTPGGDWRLFGDEPMLLAHHTGAPVVVAADRVAGARLLIERGADLVICDDGLQHLRLRRQCEIAVIDGARGLGNGALLPAGPLRESAARLNRVDAIVVNGEARHAPAWHGSAWSMTLRPDAPRALAPAGEAGVLDVGSSPRVHAVAGIGNPARFFATVRSLGFEVIEHPFADHHAFSAQELRFADGLPVLMTEKDAVKCREFANERLWYVPVTVQFGEPQGQQFLGLMLRTLGLTATTRGALSP